MPVAFSGGAGSGSAAPCCLLACAQLDFDADLGPGAPFATLLAVAVVQQRKTLVVWSSISWQLAAFLSHAHLRILVDGVVKAQLRQDTIALVAFRPAALDACIEGLALGPHTIELQWSTNALCSATCHPSTEPENYSASLIVGEF